VRNRILSAPRSSGFIISSIKLSKPSENDSFSVVNNKYEQLFQDLRRKPQ